MKKAKKYDAVKEVREYRDKMGPVFMNDPEKLKKALKEARISFSRKLAEKGRLVFGDAVGCKAPAD